MKHTPENAEELAAIVVESLDCDSMEQLVLEYLTEKLTDSRENFKINCEIQGIQFEE